MPPTDAPAGPDWWLMLRAFWRRGRQVASFAPSSRAMARAMLRGIDFESTRCVVELGAGTGPVTAEVAARLRPGTTFVAVELDPVLCARLKARFPHLDVVQADAARLDELLAGRGVRQVDHVLSGLPLPSFPAAERDSLLAAAARVLSPAGTFRQLTVMPWVYYPLYRRSFDDVRFHFVAANLPPGGVYVCRGYRGGAGST
ncbi:class I SAM-dependent methyltransferase [Urbifossiella limnaea]|uniref:16S ribosomal RNA methyltransferase KsgA/Dim1 family protein n=1 Tax=Urbifossiella limnaea TaxID=2528023 RepID=A0A517XYM2_9BACT|nr:methyltransferase domain-containing protein [Urbifossiella limnaea]QDU22609.1 16S ribosomal RNA methyltransferase KsgA/Dim1 family protein [Urbifossiella limnaea]